MNGTTTNFRASGRAAVKGIGPVTMAWIEAIGSGRGARGQPMPFAAAVAHCCAAAGGDSPITASLRAFAGGRAGERRRGRGRPIPPDRDKFPDFLALLVRQAQHEPAGLANIIGVIGSVLFISAFALCQPAEGSTSCCSTRPGRRCIAVDFTAHQAVILKPPGADHCSGWPLARSAITAELCLGMI
jgi:hypothetical protein